MRQISALALALTSFLIAVGTWWAFEKGGRDFAVFYEAWRLVLDGRGAEIYHVSPDRFLYAPGFAWLLSPLALLPKNLALALWCFGKAAVIGFVIREFGRATQATKKTKLAALGIGAWAVVLLARPILIDFQYGQVNTFILGACVWALFGHVRRGTPNVWDGVRWFTLAIAAVAKIFPLPLLIIPWMTRPSETGIPTGRLRYERYGIILGLALVLVAPAISEGIKGLLPMHLAWRDALLSKGLPLESHNQSFIAFLHHYFGSEPTFIIAKGGTVSLGLGLFSESTIRILGWTWTVLTSLALLAWLLTGKSRSTLQWIAVAIGLTIIPSHLIWKPYFIMALPLAILAVEKFQQRWWILVLLFLGINCTGFDFIGHTWGARFEAASFLLWMHLVLIGLVVVGRKPINSPLS